MGHKHLHSCSTGTRYLHCSHLCKHRCDSVSDIELVFSANWGLWVGIIVRHLCDTTNMNIKPVYSFSAQLSAHIHFQDAEIKLVYSQWTWWQRTERTSEQIKLLTLSQIVPVAGHRLFTNHVDSKAESWGHIEVSWLGQHLHTRQRAEISIQQWPDCRLNLHRRF